MISNKLNLKFAKIQIEWKEHTLERSSESWPMSKYPASIFLQIKIFCKGMGCWKFMIELTTRRRIVSKTFFF